LRRRILFVDKNAVSADEKTADNAIKTTKTITIELSVSKIKPTSKIILSVIKHTIKESF
jgi:hypothetical protein